MKKGFKKLTLRRTQSREQTGQPGASEVFRERGLTDPELVVPPEPAGVPERERTGSTGIALVRRRSQTSGTPVPSIYQVPESDSPAVVPLQRRLSVGERKAGDKKMAEARTQMTYGKEAFEWDPSLDEDKNLVNQRIWEGEQKLQMALRRLHHDKSMIARDGEKRKKLSASSSNIGSLNGGNKEDSHVTSYMSRFTLKLQRKKARNPKLESMENSTESSSVLKPGTLSPPQADASAEYLQTYAALTPLTARKKRPQKLGKSLAEKTVNEASANDSYLSRFLEDKESVAPKIKKKGSARRQSDPDPLSPKAKGKKIETKKEATSVDVESPSVRVEALRVALPRRSSSSGSLLSRPLDEEEKNSKANQPLSAVPRVLEKETSRSRASSVEVSDVEESSSTFESSEDETKKKSRKVRRKVPRSAKESPVSLENRQVTEEEVTDLISLGPELGKGAFSLVYRAERKSDGLAVAVKVVDLTRLTAKQLAELDAERFVLVNQN